MNSPVIDGIYEVLMINGPFQSIQQNILFLFVVFVPTNAITLSPAFGLANSGQLLNKYPPGNNPVVSYDAVNVTRSPYTINYGSDPLDAKKLDHSSYELNSNSQVAFETGALLRLIMLHLGYVTLIYADAAPTKPAVPDSALIDIVTFPSVPNLKFATCGAEPAKTQTYSQTESNNKFVRLEGSIQQTITGRLKYVSPFGGTYDETQDPVENTYLTMSEVDAKLTNVVTTNTTQSITGAKTFKSNVSAAGFAKTGKDDTSVLLAGGGDMLLSEFGGLELVNINYTSNVVSLTSIMSLKCYRYGSLINFYGYMYMGNGAGASDAAVAVCTFESSGFPKYLFYADDIVFAGSAPHVANFRFGTDGKV
ncbi:MAG: hypothetical protein EZS28_038478, partial [Streblomastix strix]